MCVYFTRRDSEEGVETNGQKYIYGCKLNLISQDIKLAFISFFSQAREACSEATGLWSTLYLRIIENQTINNIYVSPPPCLLIINYTLGAALSFFCPRLNASRKKQNKTHESNFLLFYPQIENKTFSFWLHIIEKKKSGPGSLRRNAQRVK